jgi:PIN domain nuclease of toxin-antitoxin system
MWCARLRKSGVESSLPSRHSLREVVRLQEPVALSAISLLEIAVLIGVPSTRSDVSGNELLLDTVEASPAIRILPLTIEVARTVVALGPSLRVHRLRLITSDERIVDSGLVPVIS